MNSIVMRDSLRNEVAKQQRIEEEMHEKREQQKMDISKLNTMINQAEEQMTKLRNRYEKAITHRNERFVYTTSSLMKENYKIIADGAVLTRIRLCIRDSLLVLTKMLWSLDIF